MPTLTHVLAKEIWQNIHIWPVFAVKSTNTVFTRHVFENHTTDWKFYGIALWCWLLTVKPWRHPKSNRQTERVVERGRPWHYNWPWHYAYQNGTNALSVVHRWPWTMPSGCTLVGLLKKCKYRIFNDKSYDTIIILI